MAATSLIGLTCRPAGIHAPSDNEFRWTIVAWCMDEDANASKYFSVVCISDQGTVSQFRLLDLEFQPAPTPEDVLNGLRERLGLRKGVLKG